MSLEEKCSETASITTKPLHANFGVEIGGVDLATAPAGILAEVVSLLRANGAIVLRNQRLTPADQVRFTRLFGPPAENLRAEYTVPGYPDIFVISNKIVDGKKIGDMDAGTGWHTDMVHVECPADVTMLYAIEVPSQGSDTLLVDLCDAWNELPEERQKFLEGRKILHSYRQLGERKGYNLTPEQLAKVPDVWHPIVRHHPADGRKTLYICRGTNKSVTGMSDEDGARLVDELVDYSTQEKFLYRHKWKVGDVLMWDNACTLHRGTPFDSKNEIRLVHRTWVQGEKPY